ncbi:MAG: iron ABC transporter substrate-binding protein, partial [Halobacteriales archaeon]|nr:iron ABC transporter substrate-binding protein [Halobacteriales archaeon]
MDDTSGGGGLAGATRRRFLRGACVTSVAGLAGCLGVGLDGDNNSLQPGQIGSGRAGREPPGGTPMAAMPPLAGSLTVYSGRGEFLVGELMAFLEDRYPDLDLRVRYDAATQLANQIRIEGQNSPADVFFTVNSGVLGLLAGEGRTTSLPDDVVGMVRSGYHDPNGH